MARRPRNRSERRDAWKRVPASLRRSANRAAIPKRDAPDSLLDAARAGILTRNTVKKGTRGAQAVYYVEHERQRTRHPELSAREAMGHERPQVVEARQISILTEDRFVILERATRGEARRAGRYASLVSNLQQGKMPPTAFERRMRSWKPIRGHRFLSDPQAVLAIVESRRAAEQDTFFYRSGRSVVA